VKSHRTQTRSRTRGNRGGQHAISVLPFDMFQRYMLTKEIFDCVRARVNNRILDAGGHPGVIWDFFPKDECVIVDLKVSERSNFVQADCKFLPFRDSSFDLVTNLDVLEHVPKQQRPVILKEFLRVSSRYVIFGGPFDSKDVRIAECRVRRYLRTELKREDEALLEHFEHGLLDAKVLRDLLLSRKLAYAEFSNAYLDSWRQMQVLVHRASTISDKLYGRVNELYNRLFYSRDNRGPCYRRIFLVDKRGTSSTLRSRTKAIRKKETLRGSDERTGLFMLLQNMVDFEETALRDELQLKDNHVGNLEGKVAVLENELQLKDNHIGNLQSKTSALGDLLQPELKDQLPLRDNHIADLDSKVIVLESQLRVKDEKLELERRRLEELDSALSSITSSFGYRVMRFYASRIDRFFPDGTRRGRVRRLVQSGLRVLTEEGLSAFMRQAYEKARIRNTVTVQTNAEPVEKQFWEMNRDEQYQVWLRNNELTMQQLAEMKQRAAEFQYRPKVSLIMPVYNTNQAWLSAAIDSVSAQAYPNWELCIVDDASNLRHIKPFLERISLRDARIKVRYLSKNLGMSGASNQALELATGDFVGFLDHDDELSQDALFAVVGLLNENPNLDLIYSDEDKLDQSGRKVEPFFKPDWSPDLLLSMNYVPHFLVMRKSLVDEVGGLRVGFEGSQDYDLVLRTSELTDKIGHISRPLYSWRKVPGSAADSSSAKPYARESAKKALSEAMIRRGKIGEVLEVDNNYRVKYAIEGDPLISIIIPTKDRVELLKRCLESIESKTSYTNYEIIIVDNGSQDQSTLSYLQSTRHKVVRFNEPFNFSRMNNFGATHAKGRHLLFLNNDTEVVEEHWLEAMLEHSERKEIGMVGALLLYPSTGVFQGIQHAGVNIGVGGVAGHAFKYLQAERSNYFNLHRVARNCSAVTSACAMITKEVFREMGGFDERLSVAFGDVDLCLRLRERGYLVIYTPYATLIHHESASRGALHPLDDEKYMITRWENELERGDPFYNRNLTLLREDYALTPYGSYERPLSLLLDFYEARPDLQATYPEVREGNHFRLVKWAATSGRTIDDVNPPLRAYFPYLQEYVSTLEQHVSKPMVARNSLS
jgi:GT2 family glycosyltransferase